MPAKPDPVVFPVIEDSLGLMAAEARDLLGRVDLVIEHLGTPPGHQVCHLLRKLRARPGEVLEMLLAAPPERLMDAVTRMRSLAAAYQNDLVAPLGRAKGELGWSGAGHQAFSRHWNAQMRHIASGDEAESMAKRLHATADFVESVAGWFSRTRQELALALVKAFGSQEAVALKSCDLLAGDSSTVREAAVTGDIDSRGRLVDAAATIGGIALGSVAEWHETGMEHFVADADGAPAGGWPAKLTPLAEDGPASEAAAAGDYGKAIWVRL
ncbi:MAG: hypothetical protein GEU94_05000 [Micromonosporaceae bacterium]|nr:hypothetical protein [Micromonosporaceae bacterium]